MSDVATAPTPTAPTPTGVAPPPDPARLAEFADRAAWARADGVRFADPAAFEAQLLAPLRAWCLAHADNVRLCVVAPPAGSVEAFVVTKSRRFDFDFSDVLASLEIRLAAAGWLVGVMQLPDMPDTSLAAFFNHDKALEIYADGGPAPGQGGA